MIRRDAELRRIVGRNIRECRRRRALYQVELGNMLGASRTVVAQWETGRKLPRIEWLLAVASEFRVTVEWLTTNH